MHTRRTTVVLVSFVAFAALVAGTAFRVGHAGGPAATVPGPESDKLLPAADGYVVTDNPPGGITAVRLPDLKAFVVRPAGPPDERDVATVHALSGPDAGGRIAYVEDHDRRHRLKTVRVDGTGDAEVFA